MMKIADYLFHGKEKEKLWLAVIVVFLFGVVTCNAGWMWYSNQKDARTEQRIEKIDRSYKYQMGQQRTKIENKIDTVIDRLDKLPPTQVIIDAKAALLGVKDG